MLDYMKLKIQNHDINQRILEAEITLETLIQHSYFTEVETEIQGIMPGDVSNASMLLVLFRLHARWQIK